jgi:mitochondrial fission protein ELM1
METMFKADKREGKIAKTIEEQTSKLPSDTFLWISIGAMATGLVLQLAKKKHMSLFIGQWVAPFLLFGIYNKLVKQRGHDMMDKA